jgi:hypothetical protein
VEDVVLVACERLSTTPVQHSTGAATSALIDRSTGCGSAGRCELILDDGGVLGHFETARPVGIL